MDSGATSLFQLSLPSVILAYTSLNMVGSTCLRSTSCSSLRSGQMSLKYTGLPELSNPWIVKKRKEFIIAVIEPN